MRSYQPVQGGPVVQSWLNMDQYWVHIVVIVIVAVGRDIFLGHDWNHIWRVAALVLGGGVISRGEGSLQSAWALQWRQLHEPLMGIARVDGSEASVQVVAIVIGLLLACTTHVLKYVIQGAIAAAGVEMHLVGHVDGDG